VQQAVTANPDNFLLWLELGHCQQAVGLVGPAQVSFMQARQLNPNSQAVNDALHGVSQVGMFARLLGKWRGLFKR
jgi:cytochrome c-type biogenesis protein CcmH/NrfG